MASLFSLSQNLIKINGGIYYASNSEKQNTKCRNVLANKSGDQMTGWLIVVLIVVVVGAVFLTLYKDSISTIWYSIVTKITSLLN